MNSAIVYVKIIAFTVVSVLTPSTIFRNMEYYKIKLIKKAIGGAPEN